MGIAPSRRCKLSVIVTCDWAIVRWEGDTHTLKFHNPVEQGGSSHGNGIWELCSGEDFKGVLVPFSATTYSGPPGQTERWIACGLGVRPSEASGSRRAYRRRRREREKERDDEHDGLSVSLLTPRLVESSLNLMLLQ